MLVLLTGLKIQELIHCLTTIVGYCPFSNALMWCKVFLIAKMMQMMVLTFYADSVYVFCGESNRSFVNQTEKFNKGKCVADTQRNSPYNRISAGSVAVGGKL